MLSAAIVPPERAPQDRNRFLKGDLRGVWGAARGERARFVVLPRSCSAGASARRSALWDAPSNGTGQAGGHQ